MNHDVEHFLDSRIPVRLKAVFRYEGEIGVVNGFFSRRIVSLNSTGCQIYKMCDGKTSVGTIVDQLQSMYKNGEKEQIRKDVYRVLRDYELNGLLSVKMTAPAQIQK